MKYAGSNFLCTKNLVKEEEQAKKFKEEFKFRGDLYLKEFYDRLRARYVVGQVERGKETGNLHLQFFVNVRKARISALKSIDTKIHIELIKFNNGADLYCMKEETRVDGPWEFGERPINRKLGQKPSKKIDWEKDVWKKAINGQIDDIKPNIKVTYYNRLKMIQKDHLITSNKLHLRGIWIYGKQGSGKTRWVRENIDPRELYPKLCTKWWDGYIGQKYVVMDDMMKDHKYLGYLLKLWADRYGIVLETKGGAVVDKYEWFIVTSQYIIDEIFDGDDRTINALRRRFKEFHIDEIKNKKFNELDLKFD